MNHAQSKQRIKEREEFKKAWYAGHCSPATVSKLMGLTLSNVLRRRAQYFKFTGEVLPTVPQDPRSTGRNSFGDQNWQSVASPKWPKRVEIELKGGSVIIGSDAHLWPGLLSTAWVAFEEVIKTEKPKYGILNGDTLDGARVTRHDPIAWESLPTLEQEIAECVERTKRLKALYRGTQWQWTCGNHDTRYERYLAKNAPEMRGIKGSCLQHHIGWPFSWSIMINKGLEPVMVKHAYLGGLHAVYRNTLQAGISIVTGHLHAQLTRPVTDYRGTRYGVDAGTLADIDGPQFHYTMDNPVNWRSGFVLLTFDEKGRLMPPELCEVQTFGDWQRAVFRGKVIVEREKQAHE